MSSLFKRKDKTAQQVAVIGLGGFGSNLVKALSKKAVDIIAVDVDERRVNAIRDYATQAIAMDATQKDNLEGIGVAALDCVIVSPGPSLEPSIMVVHFLKELGVRRIIAKALSEDHEKILTLVGATEVAYPERDSARKIANRLTFSNLLDYLPIEAGLVVHEIAPPDAFIGRSLSDIHLRKRFNVTVIAIKSLIPAQTHVNPGADFIIKESDILVVFGSEEDINRFHEKLTEED